jgi:hypothetical protein
MVELTPELAVVVVAWLVSLFIAIFAVPRLVAPKAREAWTSWLMSKDAEPYMDRLAARVEARLLPKLEEMKTVSINAGPMVAELKAELLPELLQKVESVRTWVSSKLGLTIRGLKDLGEDAIEAVGKEVLDEADPNDVLRAQLASLKVVDPDKHPYAAAGLAYLKAQLGAVPVKKRSPGGGPRTEFGR